MLSICFFGPSNIGYGITDIRYRLQRYKKNANYANFVVKKVRNLWTFRAKC